MNILIAPDKFKDALTAEEAAIAVKRGVERAFSFDPGIRTTLLPLADGGEGTCRILTQQNKGKLITSTVLGPLQEPTSAQWGHTSDKQLAYIEIAQASGLYLIPASIGNRNPMLTTTFGTGQLLASALEIGATEIVLGLGGSATNDGGTGMAAALGFRFLDNSGNEIPIPCGQDLLRIRHIDSKAVHPLLKNCKVKAACDVKNPLLGPNGATYTFAPQKGANKEMLPLLEEGLQNLSTIVKSNLGIEVSHVPGSGAAGGAGAGVIAFLGGTLESGAELILTHSNFDHHLRKADLIITGEGKIDKTSLDGKLISLVAKKARAAKTPVIAFCGKTDLTEDQLNQAGIDSVNAISEKEPDLETALRNTSQNLEDAVYSYFLMGQAF